jgi:hypothetical protein
LCFNCNRGIGAFKEDHVIVEKALKYLRNCLILACILSPLTLSAKSNKDLEIRGGTLVYVEGSHPELYFYLDDPAHTVAILADDDLSSPEGTFMQSACLGSPLCSGLSALLLSLRVTCHTERFNSLGGICTESQQMEYAVAQIKGQREIGLVLGSGKMFWLVPVFTTPAALANRGPAVTIQRYDSSFKPESANSWKSELVTLATDIYRKAKSQSEKEYECLTHLKAGQSVETLMQCGKPLQANSDLNRDQLVYQVPVYGTGAYDSLGYSEVLVYVDKQSHTIENVQWSTEIKRYSN